MQCNAMQSNAMQCNAMQCNAMQCNTMQCNTMQYNAMQCIAIQCNVMQCNAIGILEDLEIWGNRAQTSGKARLEISNELASSRDAPGDPGPRGTEAPDIPVQVTGLLGSTEEPLIGKPNWGTKNE